MSTLELVDPELGDALPQWPRLPLTADSLAPRCADLLKARGAVPPELPDIIVGEIRVVVAMMDPFCHDQLNDENGDLARRLSTSRPS